MVFSQNERNLRQQEMLRKTAGFGAISVKYYHLWTKIAVLLGRFIVFYTRKAAKKCGILRKDNRKSHFWGNRKTHEKCHLYNIC